MKTCPVCHRESDDQARFCQECGSPLPDADPKEESVLEEVSQTHSDSCPADLEQDHVEQTKTSDQEQSEQALTEDDSVVEASLTNEAKENEQEEMAEEVPTVQEEKSNTRWYYVDAGKTQGPFSPEQFEAIIVENKITPDTFIWKKGMAAWARLKETELYVELGLAPVQEEVQNVSQDEVSTVTSVHEAVTELTGVVSSTAAHSNATVNQDGIPTVPLGSQQNDATDSETEQDPQIEEDQKWYYVYRNRTVGPFSEEVMIKKIHEGEIEGESYVWREGFRDWKHLRDTKFAAYLGSYNPYGGGTSFVEDVENQRGYANTDRPLYDEENYANGPFDEVHPPHQGHPYYGNVGVSPRSIILYLLLTILTCGLFEIFWLYATVSDINRMCQRRGIREIGDPIIVVVLTFVTCGIYSIYYFWKAGQALYRLSGGTRSDNSVLLAVLGIFISPAALAIIQDQINDLVDDDVYC